MSVLSEQYRELPPPSGGVIPSPLESAQRPLGTLFDSREVVISPSISPFSQEASRQAHEAILTKEAFEGRREVEGYSIDGKFTRDRDDAFEFYRDGSGYLILVHISDVGALVPVGNELDEESKERAFSRYYGAQGTDPMYPRVLSDDRLSLHQDQWRLTSTVTIPLSSQFKPGETEIESTYLKNRRALSYDVADEILGGKIEDPTSENLQLGLFIARELAAGRKTQYDFTNFTLVSEEGELRRMKGGEIYRSAMIVRECMIRANMAVGEFAAKNGIHIITRTHIGRGERAFYSTSYVGHAGLKLRAEEPYPHFTSPIRRYADLTVHRQVNAFIEGRPAPYSELDLEEIAEGLNSTADNIEIETSRIMGGLVKAEVNSALEQSDSITQFKPDRVIKQAAANGKIDQISNWVIAGLRDGSIKAGDILPIMFRGKDDDSTNALFELIINEFPNQAMDAFSSFRDVHKIPSPTINEFTYETGEDPHEAIAEVEIKGVTIYSNPVYASRKGEARRKAIRDLIQRVRELEPLGPTPQPALS